MVVFSLTDCPAKLRGDLTKWLCEINTGVYVGKVSARVREELWTRICENLPHGKATLVYTAANEQGMEFRVHNTSWKPKNFDGLTLMKRPLPQENKGKKSEEVGEESRTAQILKAQRIRTAAQKKAAAEGFVVVDLETSGLSAQKDDIIEIGALHVVNREIVHRLDILVKPEKRIPQSIQRLTGITQQMIEEKGEDLKTAVLQFLKFIGERKIVYHNSGFDRAFLRSACERCGIPPIENGYIDTMTLAKQLVEDIPNFRLETLAAYFGWEGKQLHRAENDCEITLFVYHKLKEIED